MQESHDPDWSFSHPIRLCDRPAEPSGSRSSTQQDPILASRHCGKVGMFTLGLPCGPAPRIGTFNALYTLSRPIFNPCSRFGPMSPGKRTTRHTSDILTSAAMGPEELGVLRATPDRPSRGRSSALAIKSRALSASVHIECNSPSPWLPSGVGIRRRFSLCSLHCACLGCCPAFRSRYNRTLRLRCRRTTSRTSRQATSRSFPAMNSSSPNAAASDPFATLPKIPALDNTFGALLIGCFVGFMCVHGRSIRRTREILTYTCRQYGWTANQCYTYFRMYPGDRLILKGLVSMIFSLRYQVPVNA